MAIEQCSQIADFGRYVDNLDSPFNVGNLTEKDGHLILFHVMLFNGQASSTGLTEPSRVYYVDGDAVEHDVSPIATFPLHDGEGGGGEGMWYVYAVALGTISVAEVWNVYLELTGSTETSILFGQSLTGCYQGSYSYLNDPAFFRKYTGELDENNSVPITQWNLTPGDWIVNIWNCLFPYPDGNEMDSTLGTKFGQPFAWTRDAGATLEYLHRATGFYYEATADKHTAYGYNATAVATPAETLGVGYPIFSLDSTGPWAPPWVEREGEYVEPPCGYFGQVLSGSPDLSHLEGQVVSIYANGDVLDQQVVQGGTVNVSSTYSLVHIGLPFYSDLQTLNIEVPMKEGTMQSRREKINNVTFSFKDSRGGFIGPSEDDLWEAFTIEAVRKCTGRNYGAKDLVTEDVRQPLGAQYEADGSVFFRQSDPLPVTIGAIIPEVAVGGIAR